MAESGLKHGVQRWPRVGPHTAGDQRQRHPFAPCGAALRRIADLSGKAALRLQRAQMPGSVALPHVI